MKYRSLFISMLIIITLCLTVTGSSMAYFSDIKTGSGLTFILGKIELESMWASAVPSDDDTSNIKHFTWSVRNKGDLNVIIKARIIPSWESNKTSKTTETTETKEATEPLYQESQIIEKEALEIDSQIIDRATTPQYHFEVISPGWSLGGNGWYFFEQPVNANQIVDFNVDLIIDDLWQGHLQVYFEAEGTEAPQINLVGEAND